jgi:hypothetical protein
MVTNCPLAICSPAATETISKADFGICQCSLCTMRAWTVCIDMPLRLPLVPGGPRGLTRPRLDRRWHVQRRCYALYRDFSTALRLLHSLPAADIACAPPSCTGPRGTGHQAACTTPLVGMQGQRSDSWMHCVTTMDCCVMSRCVEWHRCAVSGAHPLLCPDDRQPLLHKHLRAHASRVGRHQDAFTGTVAGQTAADAHEPQAVLVLRRLRAGCIVSCMGSCTAERTLYGVGGRLTLSFLGVVSFTLRTALGGPSGYCLSKSALAASAARLYSFCTQRSSV